MSVGKIVGALTGEEDVDAVIEDQAADGNRVGHLTNGRDGANAQVGAIHQSGVHFDRTGSGQA